MNRSSFLAAMFGFLWVAKAQGPVGAGRDNPKIQFQWPWSKQKPKNNQCPVCGTMATAFKQLTVEEYAATHGPCAPVGHAEGNMLAVSTCRSWTKDDISQSQMVRCKCGGSAAFFQDAE